jgi:hypothetical protein
MITSYLRNSQVGMTKDQYYEMCEMMGTEPVESEIPVDFEDFPDEVQTSFQIYHLFRDVWEGMSGTYMGKEFSTVFDFFRLYEVEPQAQLFTLNFIRQIDGVRTDIFDRAKGENC